MNNVLELNEKLKELPSIFSFEDELFFVDRLQKLSIDEIKENQSVFIEIISSIQEAHQDNGLFEVTDENINTFFEFVTWIRRLETLHNLDFEKYTDGLNMNFDGSRKI